MNDFITIKQASELTGKHPDTIRALVRKNKAQTLKDAKGKVLISAGFLKDNYNLTTTDQVNSNQVESENIPTEQAISDQNGATGQLISALTAELEAKNSIIKQQQETIQKIVDQQQQLTGLLLTQKSQNPPKSTSINSIEEKATDDKATEEKVKKDKVTKKVQKSQPQKKHWWNKA